MSAAVAEQLRPASELPLEDLADEFALIRQQVMAWKPNVNPHLQRYEELSTELLKRREHEPAEKRIQVQGKTFIVPISPRENKTTITDPEAVYKTIRRLGMEKLLQAYSITLAEARKFLTEKQQAKWMKTERTGPREIGEPVLKQQAGATAA